MTDSAALGSIPACAGEPRQPDSSLQGTRVYPRVCGGTAAAGTNRRWAKGLSPRVRGNPPAPIFPVLLRGSIPACAGEPLYAAQPL